MEIFLFFQKKDMLFTYLSINKILSGAIIIIKALQFLIFTYSAGWLDKNPGTVAAKEGCLAVGGSAESSGTFKRNAAGKH